MRSNEEMRVSNEELVGVREFRDHYSVHLDALDSREVEKIVLTKNGEMRAVVLSVDHYTELVERRGK